MENIFCLESHIHLCSRHTSAIPAYVIKTCLTWHAISGARYWGFVSPKLHVSTYRNQQHSWWFHYLVISNSNWNSNTFITSTSIQQKKELHHTVHPKIYITIGFYSMCNAMTAMDIIICIFSAVSILGNRFLFPKILHISHAGLTLNLNNLPHTSSCWLVWHIIAYSTVMM